MDKREYTPKVLNELAKAGLKERGKGKFKSLVGWKFRASVKGAELVIVYKHRKRKNQKWQLAELSQGL